MTSASINFLTDASTSSRRSHIAMSERFLSSEEYDEQAHELYNDGDYEGALEMLKEGLLLYPNAVELCVGMGYARLARRSMHGRDRHSSVLSSSTRGMRTA